MPGLIENLVPTCALAVPFYSASTTMAVDIFTLQVGLCCSGILTFPRILSVGVRSIDPRHIHFRQRLPPHSTPPRLVRRGPMLTLGATATLARRVLQQPSAPLGTAARRRPRRALLPPAAGGNGEGKWGNANRLGPVGGEGSGEQWLPELDTTLLHSIDSGDGSAAGPPAAEWQQALAEKAGQLQYQYFNWRQDTRSDLQLFIFLNSLVYLFGALVQVGAAKPAERRPAVCRVQALGSCPAPAT